MPDAKVAISLNQKSGLAETALFSLRVSQPELLRELPQVRELLQVHWREPVPELW